MEMNLVTISASFVNLFVQPPVNVTFNDANKYIYLMQITLCVTHFSTENLFWKWNVMPLVRVCWSYEFILNESCFVGMPYACLHLHRESLKKLFAVDYFVVAVSYGFTHVSRVFR